jgi:hypothetical protein
MKDKHVALPTLFAIHDERSVFHATGSAETVGTGTGSI